MMASSNGAGSSSLDRLDSALNGINHRSVVLTKVTNDCAFLKKLWESAHKWSGSDHAATDEEKKNMHFFCLRIEATAEEMALELIRFREEKMVDDHPVKDEESLNELALDCATKTMRLSAEVEEALDHLYMMWSRGGDGSSGSSSSFVFDAHFCKYLLEYVQPTVSAIETMAANDRDDEDSTAKIHFHSHSLLHSLSYMKWYLLYLIALFDAVQHTHRRHHARGLPSFDACVGHVLSLALRIANRCSDYWLNCKAGRIQVMRRDLIEFLVNLRSEIHPSNPKFTGFHLNFLMALSYTKLVAFKHSLWNFCFVYLFSGSGKDGHFRDEVFFLLKLFFCATSILDDEDTARSFIPEIQAVLVEITSLFESTGRDDKKLDNSPRCSELFTKICLLKAELFLVVQIHSMKSNTNTSSPSPGMVAEKCLNSTFRRVIGRGARLRS